MGVVNMALEEMATIAAEDSLTEVIRTGIGTATIAEDDRADILNTWQTVAGVKEEPAHSDGIPPHVVIELTAMGIDVELMDGNAAR